MRQQSDSAFVSGDGKTVSRTGFLLYEDDMLFSVKALDILCFHVSHLFGVLVIISDEYWARFRHILYYYFAAAGLICV
jgi:hypothetical protein